MKRLMASVWGVICVSLPVLLLTTGPARAGEIELLSTAATESDTAGPPDWLHPSQAALSADGRWTAFTSVAANLVPGQRDHAFPSLDVFLHDRQTGATVLVSHAPGRPETAADGPPQSTAVSSSWEPSISADGRWIAYGSRATNLVPGQQPAPGAEPYAHQVFLYDRDTGINVLVSRSAGNPDRVSNGLASLPRISADGDWIAFTSVATDLGQDDTNFVNAGFDAFLYERATGQITLVSRAAGFPTATSDGNSDATSISADGRYVVLSSTSSDLVPGFTSALSGPNVFLFDRVAGTMTLVSRTSASATSGTHGEEGMVSADGSVVVFTSLGNDLVAGQVDHNALGDVFLFDRAAGTNILVSRSAAGPAETGNLPAGQPQVSADGGFVAFHSYATDAVAGQADMNANGDIFLYRRATSSVTLASRSAASPVATGNAGSPFFFQLAADGSQVVFESAATDLVAGQADANSGTDVFVFDLAAGSTSLASGAGGSAQTTGNGISSRPVLSADGDWIVFSTQATDLVSGTLDLNRSSDTVLHDRAAGSSELLTVHPPGMASATPFGESVLLSASADGRYAVFYGTADNHVAGQSPAAQGQIYLVDRQAGTTILVSHAAGSPSTPGNGGAMAIAAIAAISADGAFVAFASDATDLVAGQSDTPESVDLFLYDRAAGTTTMVSRAAGSVATAGSPGCEATSPALSEDGRWLAFTCFSSDLVAGQNDAGTDWDVFLFDRVSGQNLLVSRLAGSTATGASDSSREPVMSADGARVAYSSWAHDLVAGGGDANGWEDVFLFDRTTGQTLLVSRAAGTATTSADGISNSPSIDRQGRHVAFASTAGNLAPGVTDSGFLDDVFVFDWNTGVVELISRSAASPTTPGNGGGTAPVISGDGLAVAFLSASGNLVSGQTQPFGSAVLDLFVHDRTSRTMELISRSAASATTSGNGNSFQPSFTPDGRYLAFFSEAGNLSPRGDWGGVYLYDRRFRSLEQLARLSSLAGSGRRLRPLLSDDGSVVFFTSEDPWLADDDFNTRDDVFAYVRSAPQGSDFFTVSPCRVETGTTVFSGSTLLLAVHGVCGVPATATAVAVNVTVTQPTGTGRLTLHPGNLAAPLTSTLNFAAGRTLANNAILPLALNGEGSLAVTPFVNGNGSVRVILDVSGYFE